MNGRLMLPLMSKGSTQGFAIHRYLGQGRLTRCRLRLLAGSCFEDHLSHNPNQFFGITLGQRPRVGCIAGEPPGPVQPFPEFFRTPSYPFDDSVNGGFSCSFSQQKQREKQG